MTMKRTNAMIRKYSVAVMKLPYANNCPCLLCNRGQLRKLAEPTITSTGKRIPGLKLDHPRQLALMHALVRFAHVAADNTFTTAEIYPAVIKALGCVPDSYTLASLRYDLSKLRAKGLVAKLPNSRRYQLLPQGYSICLIFLKLFERVYAPLTAGLLSPFKADKRLESQRRVSTRSPLSARHRRSRYPRPSRRLKSRVTSTSNENKFPATGTITV